MSVAREADAEYMQDHERQRDVGERAVHFPDNGLPTLGAFRFPTASGFISPGLGDCRNDCALGRERAFAALAISDDSGCDGPRETDKQRDYHRASGRAVAEIAARMPGGATP